jgi:hypothetical protein
MARSGWRRTAELATEKIQDKQPPPREAQRSVLNLRPHQIGDAIFYSPVGTLDSGRLDFSSLRRLLRKLDNFLDSPTPNASPTETLCRDILGTDRHWLTPHLARIYRSGRPERWVFHE